MRYGFPVNPYFSDYSLHPNHDDQLWLAYITRVAVAMANNPNRTFAGDATALSQAGLLMNGDPFFVRDYENSMPAIVVNGARWAADLGNVVAYNAAAAQSVNFSVTYNRRNHNNENRFRFEWCPNTPAGAELIVNGSLLATAPANSSTVFHGNVSFHIRMPNTLEFHNNEAKVYLVGIHNQFAGRVWLMQNPADRDGWQDVVFYIPYMRSGAVFSFEPDTIPPTNGNGNGGYREPPREAPPASVRIQKICVITRENIPGALMRIEGRSSHQIVTGDGQIWEIDNRGIDMSIVLTEGHTLPYVPQQPVDNYGNPIGRPPVSFELTDGVLTIHNLPWGYYRVQEERAPDGYSLLPQHTATISPKLKLGI